MRQQQDTEEPHELKESSEDVQLLTEEAAELLQSMPTDLAAAGPVAFARHLVEAATLNQDQQAPVALIAKEMQMAWEKQGKPQRMHPVGRILRMLLLGGGGCGKSRIVNLVLTPLFLQFWGPRGCVKAAPSNKAARGILGKTLHVVAKLRGGSLNMMNLRCGTAAQRAHTYGYHVERSSSMKRPREQPRCITQSLCAVAMGAQLPTKWSSQTMQSRLRPSEPCQ